MSFCPANCQDETLTPNAPLGCELETRERNIDRIGFYGCSTDLPNPLTCAGLETLVEQNLLTFSSPLALIEVADPTFEELVIRDCAPAQRRAVERTITFQDRIAINLLGNEFSPAINPNPFYDYTYWDDKQSKQATMRYLIVFCDGSVQVPRDKAGNPMTASLDIFVSFERQGSGGTSYILEIKKGQLSFKGDPFALSNPPELTAGFEVFDLTDCDIL